MHILNADQCLLQKKLYHHLYSETSDQENRSATEKCPHIGSVPSSEGFVGV